MKYRLFLSRATASVLGSTAFAGPMGPVIPSKDWTWVASIAAGPIWVRAVRHRLFIWRQRLKRPMRREFPPMLLPRASCLLAYKNH